MNRNKTSIGQILSWIRKGAWAVLDQALFALSNFALNIMLARWLPLEDFGAFSVSLAFFLFASRVHESFYVQPMLIFGSSNYRSRLFQYFSMLLRYEMVMAVVVLASFVAVSGYFHVFRQAALAQAFLGLAISTPLVLVFWLVRRTCYVLSAPHLSTLAGLIYMALLLSGTFLLFHLGRLDIITALSLTGLSSAAASVALVTMLWRSGRLSGGRASDGVAAVPALRQREVLGRHFGYGKWAVAIQFVVWISESLPSLLVSAETGLDAAATLRVLLLLMMPLWQTVEALCTILLPTLVRSRGSNRFASVMKAALLIFLGLATGYGIVLWLLQGEILDLLYAGKYSSETEWRWLLSIMVIFSTAGTLLLAALRALNRPDSGFYATAAATVAVTAAALLLIPALGVNGALVAMLLGSVASTAVMAWKLVSALRHDTPVPEPGTVKRLGVLRRP